MASKNMSEFWQLIAEQDRLREGVYRRWPALRNHPGDDERFCDDCGGWGRDCDACGETGIAKLTAEEWREKCEREEVAEYEHQLALEHKRWIDETDSELE
jgi:hypothetical protein